LAEKGVGVGNQMVGQNLTFNPARTKRFAVGKPGEAEKEKVEQNL